MDVYYLCPYCETLIAGEEADAMDVCPVCGNAIESQREEEDGYY